MTKSAAVKTHSKPSSKTLADFRAAHDPNVYIPARLRKALEQMRAEHEESWLYEAEFLQRAGVSNNYISQFREQFAEHIVETGGKHPKRVWFASAKIARLARGGPANGG